MSWLIPRGGDGAVAARAGSVVAAARRATVQWQPRAGSAVAVALRATVQWQPAQALARGGAEWTNKVALASLRYDFMCRHENRLSP